MQRAALRKVFWDVPPLAAGAQDVHHAGAWASWLTSEKVDALTHALASVFLGHKQTVET
jgi:hypothetical protein